jgi:YD repeat-containing protein
MTCKNTGRTNERTCVCRNGTVWYPPLERCVLATERAGPPPGKCGKNPPSGNPIYPFLGSKRERIQTGFVLAGQELVLTYDSTPKLPMSPGSRPPIVTKRLWLGPLWDSSLNRRLTVQGTGGGGLGISADRGDGNRVTFTRSGTTYTAPTYINDRLVKTASGYLYLDVDSEQGEVYDNDGNLLSLSAPNGSKTTLQYSTSSTPIITAPAPGYLISAQDNKGRLLNFSYTLSAGLTSDKALLTSVADVAGNSISITYDAARNLSKITWPDAQFKSFLYTSTAFPWALTGIKDENQAEFATFTYDVDGRAASTEHSGVEKYSVTYSQPPFVVGTEVYNSVSGVLSRSIDWSPPGGTALLNPAGASIGMTTTTIDGRTYLSSRSQPAGSGCSASTSSQTYDSNGNVASRDDFNGTRACYASDPSRNVETVRVEGLGNAAVCSGMTTANAALPVGSRKVSTAWHPDWRLEAKVAEPGRLTTSIYNGQPDPFNGNAVANCSPGAALLPDGKAIVLLCKRVEQATSDVDGHLGFGAALQSGVVNRVQQWTYNPNGQVLTAKDPLNNTTTYVYYTDTSFSGTDPNAVGHTVGDLQTVTNALGKVTTYAQYNKYGQVIQTTDPNAILTINTYDLRQRLLGTNVGGLQTTNTYDSTGQLISVALPDGTTQTQSYDTAHRLISTTDGAGNTTSYTLDNAGNRIGEQVKDVNGQLTRSVTRSFDALGRLQGITGAKN